MIDTLVESARPAVTRQRRMTLTPARTAAIAIVVAFVLLSVFYSILTPLYEAPDEISHFAYVAHLVTAHSLPVQQLGQLGEAHQPPLYYLAVAPLSALANWSDSVGAFLPRDRTEPGVNQGVHHTEETFPYHGLALAVHLARLGSVIMGSATVALTIAIGWQLLPSQPLAGLLAGVLVAFTPQFLFISGSINNDNLLTMAMTGAWWQMLRLMRRPARWPGWLGLGLWVSVAFLAKPSGLVAAPLAAGLLVACAYQKRSLRLLITGGLAMSAVFAVSAGWWLVRNQVLYGDPLGWRMFQQVFAILLRQSPLRWSDLSYFFTTQLNSFAGLFGWMNVWAPSWFYSLVRIIFRLGLLGLAIYAIVDLRRASAYVRAGMTFLALAVVAMESYILWSITKFSTSWYQGRYLFPVIGPLMVLLAVGLLRLVPRRFQRPAVSAAAIALLGLAIFMPARVIEPIYRSAMLPKWDAWLLPHKTGYVFGNSLALRGFRLEQDATASRATITLYWQAVKQPDFNYSAFVHLLGQGDQVIDQQDHAPGEKLGYPPSIWQAGDLVADPHTVTLPGTRSPGDILRFRVGLYNWQTGAQLPITQGPAPANSWVIIETKP